MAAVQKLEVVDAHGAGALDDSSAEWCGNVLRMVCGAIPVIPRRGAIFNTCRFGLPVKEREGYAREGKNAGINL